MVRVASGAALLVAALVAGCFGPADPPDSDAGPADGSADTVTETPAGVWQLEAPHLTVGQAWTYSLAGFWDATTELTVVVAEASREGYLMAAGSIAELGNEVAWDLPYLGRFAGDLSIVNGWPQAPLLKFPMTENLTWEYYDQLNVTVHRAEVEALGEAYDGARIEGANDEATFLVEYAPDIGFVTKLAVHEGGELAWSLDLTAIASGVTEWAWFERGNEVFGGGLVDGPAFWDPASEPPRPSPPADLVVGDEDDAVVVWWLGAEGSTGLVAPPPAGPPAETFEGAGAPNFELRSFAAVPGSWRFSGAPGDANGWAYFQGHAVRWVGPS